MHSLGASFPNHSDVPNSSASVRTMCARDCGVRAPSIFTRVANLFYDRSDHSSVAIRSTVNLIDKPMLFPFAFNFVEQADNSSNGMSVHVPGLPNTGNHCFLIALTQAFLGGNEEVLAGLLHAEEQVDGEKREALAVLRGFLIAYLEKKTKGEDFSAEEAGKCFCATRKALDTLNGSSNMFSCAGSQHDPQEVWTKFSETIIDTLDALKAKEFWCPPIMTFQQMEVRPGQDLGAKHTEDFELFDSEEKIVCSGANGSVLRMPIKCKTVTQHVSIEGFEDLCLEKLAPDQDVGFYKYLERFFYSEPQTEETKETLFVRFKDQTGEQCPILTKRRYFLTAPRIFWVHLDRNKDGQKIDGPIPGIGTGLQLTEACCLDCEKAQYKLGGAILHEGDSVIHGHYTAVRQEEDVQGRVQYIYANDSVVEKISQQKFLEYVSGYGFLLLYSRMQPQMSCQEGAQSKAKNSVCTVL